MQSAKVPPNFVFSPFNLVKRSGVRCFFSNDLQLAAPWSFFHKASTSAMMTAGRNGWTHSKNPNSTLHKQGQSHNHRQWSLQTSPRSVLELSYFQGGGFDVDDDDQFGQWASSSQTRMTPSAGFGKVRKVNPLSDKLPLTSMSFRRAALALSAQLCLHVLCFTRCFPACSPF